MDLSKILDTAPEPAILDSRNMEISGDTSGDYWLPTSMCLYQKELTDQIVSLHYSDVLKYFETSDYKEDVVLQSMKTMCLNSELVATHPYLLLEDFMPKSLLSKDIPGHLVESSGKFAVLRDLVKLTQEHETNTLILCRPGKTMDLIEALLVGNKVNIKRYDGQSIKSKQKKTKFVCTCHLMPSIATPDSTLTMSASIRLNLVVCVDPSVDTSVDYIQRIIKQNGGSFLQGDIPTVRLAVINSIDHCELYFGKKFERDSREYLVNVSAAMVVLRDVVGTLPPDLRPIYSQNLRYLTEWLSVPQRPWPLPDIYPIRFYTATDVESSLLTEVKYDKTSVSLEEAFGSGKKRNVKYSGQECMANRGVSYYEIKRLKNDYNTNPLKQDMANLAGMTSTKGKWTEEYPLSGILTHKLIQSLVIVYGRLKMQYSELNHIELAAENQKKILELDTKDYEDIKTQFNKLNNLVAENELLVIECLEESKDKRRKIQSLEGEISKLILSSVTQSPQLERLLSEINHINHELVSEKQSLVSKESEINYMEEEIARATASINESFAQTEQLEVEIENLQQQLNQGLLDDRENYELVKKEISLLELEISRENELLQSSRSQMSSIINDLKKLQTPRVRSSVNGKKLKQRRYI